MNDREIISKLRCDVAAQDFLEVRESHDPTSYTVRLDMHKKVPVYDIPTDSWKEVTREMQICSTPENTIEFAQKLLKAANRAILNRAVMDMRIKCYAEQEED